MADIEKGDVFEFGMDFKFAGLVVTGFSEDKKLANEAECENEIGNVIGWRGDDKRTEGKIDVRVKKGTSTLPEPGDNIRVKGIIYHISNVSNKRGNKSFMEATLSIKLWQYITLAAPVALDSTSVGA